jgi:hypothetical protein
MTHVEGLYNPSTDDFPGHYGWPALMDLAPEQAIMNGDNYGFYANGMVSFSSSSHHVSANPAYSHLHQRLGLLEVKCLVMFPLFIITFNS